MFHFGLTSLIGISLIPKIIKQCDICSVNLDMIMNDKMLIRELSTDNLIGLNIIKRYIDELGVVWCGVF